MYKADIVFTTANDVIANLIRHRTWGPWSHVMLATGQGNEVISADVGGVIKRQMTEEELKLHAILYYPALSEQDGYKIIEWAEGTVGAGYDYWGLGSFIFNWEMQDDEKFFCSEHVFLGYKQRGIYLLKRVPPSFVSPRNLWITPSLERRWE